MLGYSIFWNADLRHGVLSNTSATLGTYRKKCWVKATRIFRLIVSAYFSNRDFRNSRLLEHRSVRQSRRLNGGRVRSGGIWSWCNCIRPIGRRIDARWDRRPGTILWWPWKWERYPVRVAFCLALVRTSTAGYRHFLLKIKETYPPPVIQRRHGIQLLKIGWNLATDQPCVSNKRLEKIVNNISSLFSVGF